MATETKLSTPQQFLISGEITSISDVITKNNGKPFRVLVINTGSQVVEQPVNAAFFDKNTTILKLNSKVSLKMEKRIKDVTGYTNAEGKMVAHTSNGNTITGCSLMSSQQAKEQWANYGMEHISNSKPEYANALGTFLAGGFGR